MSQRELLVQVWAVGLEQAEVIAGAVDQHARALEVVVDCEPLLPVSMFTLARALHEGALTLCWLYDPLVSPAQRLVRAAAVSLAMVEESHRGLRDLPNPPQVNVAHTQEGLEGIRGFLERAGFTFAPRRPGQPYSARVSRGGITENLTLNTTDAAQRYTPNVTFLWHGGSGAAHSRGWFINGVDASDPAASYAAILPLLDMCDALVKVAAAYGGFEPGPHHRKTHMRRIALARVHSGPGVFSGYEEYAGTPGPR